MMLTVCIPYRLRDKPFYDRLIFDLHSYIGHHPVQISSLPNNGQKTIGEYRQELLNSVTTPYVCFIDADDKVHRDYFNSVFKGISYGAKVIGLKGEITTSGRNPSPFTHSVKISKWHDKTINRVRHYYRPPNHLNPILTDIAKQVGYSPLRHGEDLDYSTRLSEMNLLRPEDEYMPLHIMYYYLYRPRK